jgi:multidrug efflux pump subunit AcrA (membrane-fusion protein)
MNTRKSLWLIPLVLIMAAPVLPLRAAEMVTIPKSRLEELERKEAELEKFKAELNQTQSEKQRLESERARLQGEQEQLKKDKAAAEAKAVAAAKTARAEAVIPRDTPPMTTLPPLQKGEIVDAMDLMNHYRADAPAAEKRYGAQAIRVQGEVTGFEKPMFLSYYEVYLKTTDPNWNVMCRVYPPEMYSAVFTAKGGEGIIGSTSAGARTTLAKVGQIIVVEGRCNGLHSQTVTLSSCALQSAQ